MRLLGRAGQFSVGKIELSLQYQIEKDNKREDCLLKPSPMTQRTEVFQISWCLVGGVQNTMGLENTFLMFSRPCCVLY